MKNRMIAGVLVFAAFTGLMTGCVKKANDSTAEAAQDTTSAAAVTDDIPEGGHFIVTLYPDIAPESCANFEKLVSEGFYNGLTFHRVVEDFMAQGGDPTGDGTGGSAEKVKGEFSANGVENTLSHQRGVISMARSSDYDSASSQFFICYTDCSFLDGSYAAFGEVTEGMEVVDDFLKIERAFGNDNALSAPKSPIIMKTVQMIDDDADGNPRVEFVMNDFLASAAQ